MQALAIDVWDGGEPQVEVFDVNANINYPILMFGGQAGIMSDYNCSYDYFFIIGGDGIIKWRGNWDEVAMTAAMDAAVAELDVAPVDDVPFGGNRLLANYPNPFNPQTRIPYELAADDVEVKLEIVDLRGRVVRTLVQGRQQGGQRYEVVWDGRDSGGRLLPSGSYLARLQVDSQPQSRVLTLVK